MDNNKLKNNDITQLRESFKGIGEVNGYLFTKVLENDFAFIYKKQINNRISYEVFEKRINKYYNCISYPTSKSFGIWAFDVSTYDKALEIFIKMSID